MIVNQLPESGSAEPLDASGIECRGVEHIYGTGEGATIALSRLDLEIPRNQIVTVVGPSGCGKSTLLYILAGLLRPTTGEVTLGGRLITGPGADRAMVFQSDAVFPWYTVRQNLEYGPRSTGVPAKERDARVNQFLALVGLEERADKHPKELSGGMRKRVDLARAYTNHPEVLLMDEPFGALDAITKERMQYELLRLAQARPTTIVFITHDLEEALFVGDRVIVMSAGPARVVADIDVPFGSERSDDLRADPEFQKMRRDLRDVFATQHRNPENLP